MKCSNFVNRLLFKHVLRYGKLSRIVISIIFEVSPIFVCSWTHWPTNLQANETVCILQNIHKTATTNHEFIRLNEIAYFLNTTKIGNNENK